MRCPKCNEGILSKIQFKKSEKIAFLCNICESFWFDEEHIALTNAHTIDDSTQEQEFRESFEYLEKKDQDHEQNIDERKRELYETS